MAKRALSWRRAAAIGWRDLKSAPGKFGFVVLSVAVGVAALVGVRGFSESFRRQLTLEARALMAGDVSARLFRSIRPEEQKKLDALQAQGVRSTAVVETISMASVPPDPVPILVTLKAVDPGEYPYYGQAELEPRMSLPQALTGDSAIVAEEFLIRLNAHVGDSLRLGGRLFRIAAILRQEPDRMSAGAGMGPRVMISRASLDALGLIGPNSRNSQRLLMKIPPSMDSMAMRKQVEAILPDAQVMEYKEGNPALTKGLDNATSALSLICLVAMVLGAIGVAMAMHAHLEQRMDMLAILKAVGAGSGDLLRIFLTQTLGLGLAGAVLGVAAGLGVMAVLPRVFGNLIPVQTHLEFPWRSIAAGLGTGLLTTLLFCLPPLLDVRRVRPVLVLRRLVEAGPEGVKGWIQRWASRWLQLLIAALVVAALGGIAWGLTDSPKVGSSFAVFFTITLAVLLVLAALLLWALRLALHFTRLRLPSALRHGLANLYRPGNQSAAVMAALGTGVMLILAVYLVQSTLLRELRETAAPRLPNIFLIDVTAEEADPVREFFRKEPGVTEPLDLMATVQGRIQSLNGTPVSQLRDQHYPRHLLEQAELTWADQPPVGDSVIRGAWWKGSDSDQMAVAEGVADRLHLAVGMPVEIEIGGTVHTLKIAAIYHVDGQHLGTRVNFVLPRNHLADQPASWIGGARVNPRQVSQLERDLFRAYPLITVINVADILERIESIVDQVTFVVRFLAGFSILAGLSILASSIASTRFRRMREAVVLKTLGATRLRVIGTFSVEFAVLGLMAGVVGVTFANLLTRSVLAVTHSGIVFQVAWRASTLAMLGTAVLATAAGWIASYRILGLRPLEVLREE
jgi:putative ABC transport system permease protein